MFRNQVKLDFKVAAWKLWRDLLAEREDTLLIILFVCNYLKIKVYTFSLALSEPLTSKAAESLKTAMLFCHVSTAAQIGQTKLKASTMWE